MSLSESVVWLNLSSPHLSRG